MPAPSASGAPIAVAIVILRATIRFRPSSGRKSRIHGFHAAPEIVPNAAMTSSSPKRAGTRALLDTAQGSTSTPSAAVRPTSAAHQQMAFRRRQRSMSATVGSWSTWVAGARAARRPTWVLEAPRRRA
jgi:hypothetical protein